MSKTRTGPKENKNAFGSGIGLAEQFGGALARVGVNESMIHNTRVDPIRLGRVAAIMRGGHVSSDVSLDTLVAREVEFMGRICALGNLLQPSDEEVREALQKAEAEWGGLSEHDRFVPAGLDLSGLFQALYAWNDEQRASGQTTLKLAAPPREEWWRTNSEVESLPTQAGIIRQDLSQAMATTDLAHRPFNLTFDEQVEWAQKEGGNHLTSVEETLYLGFRSVLERGRPLWTAGWARCRNAYGRGYSLEVYWDADGGLDVGYDDRAARDGYRGALVRKFVAL